MGMGDRWETEIEKEKRERKTQREREETLPLGAIQEYEYHATQLMSSRLRAPNRSLLLATDKLTIESQRSWIGVPERAHVSI